MPHEKIGDSQVGFGMTPFSPLQENGSTPGEPKVLIPNFGAHNFL